jgi:hypothetical protein
VVDTWPSNVGSPDGASSVKVPSEIRYIQGGYEWGFQIPAIAERHHWFKLYVEGFLINSRVDSRAFRSY